jgi:hypothetical protein
MADQRETARSSGRCTRLATVISVVALAAIVAIVSFGHMRELALRHGEAPWSATLIPLSVDGMVVAASMSVLLASKMGRRGDWLPWTLLIVGSLASLAANVAVADPSVVSRLIAAWPSFAFVGAYHLLQGQVRIGRTGPIAPTDEAEADPPGCPLDDGTKSAWLLNPEGVLTPSVGVGVGVGQSFRRRPAACRSGHCETLQPQSSMGAPGQERW